MGAPNIQQQLYLAKALNENTDEMFDHPEMNEAVTRKHFQQVADIIKAHPDPKKRAELAAHHAEIFKKQNPRFDHERFFKAANAEKPMNEEEMNEEWGGGFQSSSDAQRQVQSELRANYKKNKAEKIKDIKAVLSGKMTKNAFTRKHKTSFGNHPLAKKIIAQRAAKSTNPMNEEEIGEESISEGYTKKAMRAAGTPKFFDLENRATASELRRGGASKRTMKKYFNTDGNYSAGSRALARFNKKAGVNAGAARLSAHATKMDAKRKAARIAEESISEWLLRKIELAEGSRGKSRLERIRGTPGADNQARDRAEISRERRRAGLSPRIPDSSVQAAMLKKTKKGKTVFGVSSEPYAIDSLGNPVPKGTKPYRAAARVPKAVLKRREEAKIKEMKGKYKKANP